MATRITASEFPHVIALLQAKLVEAGLGAWEIEPWLTKAGARLVKDHHDGTCAYFVEFFEGRPIGMAGALLCEHHSFLSLKTALYGQVVDEYVLSSQRGRGFERMLRATAVAWITENSATVILATSPDAARRAVNSGGGKL